MKKLIDWNNLALRPVGMSINKRKTIMPSKIHMQTDTSKIIPSNYTLKNSGVLLINLKQTKVREKKSPVS